MAEELEIEPHSINLSLDISGKTEKLPPEEALEFITMCGHGMISRNLVSKLIQEVREGEKTSENAAKIMASPCVCGFSILIGRLSCLVNIANKKNTIFKNEINT